MTSQKGVVTAAGRSPGWRAGRRGAAGALTAPGWVPEAAQRVPAWPRFKSADPTASGLRGHGPHRGPERGDTRTGRRMRLERRGGTATARPPALPGPEGRGAAVHRHPHPERIRTPRSLAPGRHPHAGRPPPQASADSEPGLPAPQLRQPRLDSRARRTPGPLLSGQRDPPIGALGPALGRWILAPHTHRASLPRFAARADWLQYRTPKPNQRLQPPPPPPLPLPRKMANLNKEESGLPPTAFAQAPSRPRPITPANLAPPSRQRRAGVPGATPTSWI